MVTQSRDLRFQYKNLENLDENATEKITERETKDKKLIVKILVFAVVFILWQAVWAPTQNFKTEEKLAQLQKSSYLKAYEIGWIDQCEAIFFRLGGIENYVFGKGIQLSYPQCISLKNSTFGLDSFDAEITGEFQDASIYEIKEIGRNEANKELLNQIFSISPYWCYGSECLSEKDFGIFRP